MPDELRPSWDDYFLGIAKAVAVRADCSRRKVGAVIVRDKRIISCGYNGAPSGHPGCLTDGACPRARSDVEPGAPYDTGAGACIAVHAEQNAIIYADGMLCRGAVLYCTDEPCEGCAKLILGAGITRVVWLDGAVTLPVPLASRLT